MMMITMMVMMMMVMMVMVDDGYGDDDEDGGDDGDGDDNDPLKKMSLSPNSKSSKIVRLSIGEHSWIGERINKPSDTGKDL